MAGRSAREIDWLRGLAPPCHRYNDPWPYLQAVLEGLATWRNEPGLVEHVTQWAVNEWDNDFLARVDMVDDSQPTTRIGGVTYSTWLMQPWPGGYSRDGGGEGA